MSRPLICNCTFLSTALSSCILYAQVSSRHIAGGPQPTLNGLVGIQLAWALQPENNRTMGPAHDGRTTTVPIIIYDQEPYAPTWNHASRWRGRGKVDPTF